MDRVELLELPRLDFSVLFLSSISSTFFTKLNAFLMSPVIFLALGDEKSIFLVFYKFLVILGPVISFLWPFSLSNFSIKIKDLIRGQCELAFDFAALARLPTEDDKEYFADIIR